MAQGHTRKQLISTVLNASESDAWEEAVKEWDVVDCLVDNGRSRACICGQERLKLQFTIRNRINGHELFPIGSSCIDKFGEAELSDRTKAWQELVRLIGEAERLGKGQAVGLKSGFFSRRLLRFFYEQGVLKSVDTYEYLVDRFNSCDWDGFDEEYVEMHIAQEVYPYLRDVWAQMNLPPEKAEARRATQMREQAKRAEKQAIERKRSERQQEHKQNQRRQTTEDEQHKPKSAADKAPNWPVPGAPWLSRDELNRQLAELKEYQSREQGGA